jgi:hypothetical protein
VSGRSPSRDRNLANSLKTHYKLTGKDTLLDETIVLEREAIVLVPQGHPNRALSCGNLAILLRMRYNSTGDDCYLHEFSSLTQKALNIGPVHTVWKYSSGLSWMYLQRTSSLYDVTKAIQCLSCSLEYNLDDISQAVSEIVNLINHIWSHDTKNKHAELTNIYERLIYLLLLLANSTLEVQPQLLALRGCSRIGSDAFISAVLADKTMFGFGLLELA